MLKMHGDLPFKCSQDLPRIEEPLRIEITLGFLKGPLYIGRRGGVYHTSIIMGKVSGG